MRRPILAAAMAVFALGAMPVAARPLRLALPRVQAAPDPAGGRLRDVAGREVLLRGVNVNALAEYSAYGTLPTVYPLAKDEPAIMAGIGWNAVRLLVSWSRVEPAPGHYDEAYLREIAAHVKRLARANLYTIIDFHQDAWGPTLAARAGETCASGEPAFGWDGAPGWATLDGGAARCFTLFREINPAVQAAFAAFWRNAPGPDGVGIRTRYALAVAHVARRFARTDGVVGYDVMNEPNALDAEKIGLLDDLYAETLAAVREAERSARGFPHLLFFEPSILWSDFSTGTPADFTRDDQVVFAPHIYRGGLTAGPIPREDFERARSDAATFGGAPVFVGEWGSAPDRARDAADDYFRRHQALQDEFRFSATLWTWRESCGDPHKAGDVRAGRVPEVWGEFDVDCTTNSDRGPRQALVDQLTRAWVRAAPGRLDRTAYDPATGWLEAAGSEARRGAQLVAYYPRRLHGTPDVDVTGLRRVRVRPAAGGGSYLVGRATGGAWSLTARP